MGSLTVWNFSAEGASKTKSMVAKDSRISSAKTRQNNTKASPGLSKKNRPGTSATVPAAPSPIPIPYPVIAGPKKKK